MNNRKRQNKPILNSSDGFAITPSDALTIAEDPLNVNEHTAVALFSGTGGDFHVLRAGGGEVTYLGIAASVWMPILVSKVFATGTTATGIIGETGLD